MLQLLIVFCRVREAPMIQLLIVLYVVWRSGAIFFDCFCRLYGAQMLQLWIILYVVWHPDATTIDCFAGSVALPCYNH